MSLVRTWDKRVAAWHSHVTSGPGFERILATLLSRCEPRPTDACVDLGAGTGFVTTAIAPEVDSVLAVDVSPAMAKTLAGHICATPTSGHWPPRQHGGCAQVAAS